jgi:signal transduction histidine kinase
VRLPGRSADGIDEWQLYLNVVIVAIAAFSVRPVGFHDKSLALLVLLVVNGALVLQRSIPDSVIGPRLRLWLLAVAVVASALILGLDSDSFASVFPFFVAGHAGFKLPARLAIGVALTTSALCVVALVIAGHHDPQAAPWYLGLFTGLPVFIGQTNRAYREAIDAAQLALAEAQRATAAEARAQTLAERGRIARDVHDVLAHSLAGINMQLEVADALLDQGRPDEARQATRKAQGLVREGLTEVQRTVTALRDATLPLPETLERMVASAGGAQDTTTSTGTPRAVPTEIGQVLVRTAQEGLTNAHKHAPGTPVRLALGYDDASISLDIVNGPGEPHSATSGEPADAATSAVTAGGSGMGLVGMRERVELAGGTAVIGPVTSGPDLGGWSIRVVIPT